jgi:Predicted aminopeptidases
MKRGILFPLIFIGVSIFGQDLQFARQQVKLLTSSAFHGRGYVKNGDHIAEQYIAKEFSKYKLAAFGNGYIQPYQFHINTFPGRMSVTVDGKKLVPGIDFLVYPPSSGINGIFNIELIDSSLFKPGFQINDLFATDHSHSFILLDTLGWNKDKTWKQVFDLLYINMIKASGVILLTDKDLIQSVSQFSVPFCSLIIKRSSIAKSAKTIKVNIQNKEVEHKAFNVVGYIPGQIDSFLVITAHYDHLGMMGKKTFFPGANDNASGTAMLLDFARSFSTSHTKPKYAMVFMSFSGEEAGLLGSTYYTEHPMFPLSKIRMLLNLDMVGSGSDGVTVFNGGTYPKEYAKLDSLNKALKLNIVLKSKGLSKGSDHYLFHQKNVPTLFFNTGGKEVGYHVVGDNFKALPFTVYENLFELIDAYLKTF